MALKFRLPSKFARNECPVYYGALVFDSLQNAQFVIALQGAGDDRQQSTMMVCDPRLPFAEIAGTDSWSNLTWLTLSLSLAWFVRLAPSMRQAD